MKTQVNIAKIKEAIKIISEFNKLRLRDIEFVENGIIIEVPDKILKEWSYTGLNNKDFIDSLLKEVVLRQDYLGTESISTIYFGGGTPSLFSIKEIESILFKLYKLFIIEENCEIKIRLRKFWQLPKSYS